MTTPLVEPQTVKGCQDLLPEEMIARSAVIDKIKRVYESYGFAPIDTPALEHLATLVGTGGAEINKELFRLASPEGEPLAMRFDLTVPFARLIAQYPEQVRLPFRRYHIGPVFRADDPAPGRYRQFTQFDIDVAGVASIVADAEIIATMCEVMESVGLENPPPGDSLAPLQYQVRVNNRRLIDALMIGSGITETAQQKHVLRVVDKLLKVGVESIRAELGPGRIDKSGDPIPGVGLNKSAIDAVLAFISTTADSRIGIVEALSKQLPDTEDTVAALDEMRSLDEALTALGVAETSAIFDPSLTRGLDYYTGPVFEASVPGGAHGSFMGGGRYDRLVERFLDHNVPATGASIGVDRLMLTLKQMGKLDLLKTPSKAIVISTPGVAPRELLLAAGELRAGGIETEVFLSDSGARLSEQLAYANEKAIPVAAILGEDEIQTGKVSIKNLKAGMKARAEIQDREAYRKAGKSGQVTVSRQELVATVAAMLSEE